MDTRAIRPPKFLQIHTLTSYPAALLNRDDVGQAKRITFGNAERTRISSQCLKRHWRTHEGPEGLLQITEEGQAVPTAVRSRRTFEEYVRVPLEKAGTDAEVARVATETLMNIVLGESVKKKEAKKKKEDEKSATDKSSDKIASASATEVPRERLETNQVTVIGDPEIRYLAKELSAVVKTIKDADKAEAAVRDHFTQRELAENLRTMRLGAGLDAAMFGRMVTGDVLARCDAALYVAHAMTVHGEQSQPDYFSVVDDLFSKGENPQMGSGHINTAELTSGLYYGFVIVNVPKLVSNLEGCPESAWEKADFSLARTVVDRMVRLIATVTPGAKLGSTAPFACAELVFIEAGNRQPRTLANAFLTAVDPVPNLLVNTYNALTKYVTDVDAMYGASDVERRFAAVRPTDSMHTIATREEKGIDGLAKWMSERL